MQNDAGQKAEILAEHYQKTYELTYELWNQRNRIFLVLVGVIGIATFLTFRAPEANSLLVDLISNALGIEDQERVDELRASFPYGLLQSILLVIVFYLTVNLYHRAFSVLRNYHYLGQLEIELRRELRMSADSISFTRESTYYWQGRPFLLSTIKWAYVSLLGALLLSFLIGRIYDDFAGGNLVLSLVDATIAVPIMTYFVAYTTVSIQLDNPQTESPRRVG